MITTTDLSNLIQHRLLDAETLFNAERYDGAVYLCGYAVEIALKNKICETLNWTGFPSTANEFNTKKSLKTHSFDILLSFTGIEVDIKTNYFAEWSAVNTWNPEDRYNANSIIGKDDANLMIESAKTLIAKL